jgi:hypothetical protein
MNKFNKFSIVDIEIIGERGYGIVIDFKVPDEENNQYCYKVAVVAGSYDMHRNALSELWVNENEMKQSDRVINIAPLVPPHIPHKGILGRIGKVLQIW